MKKPLSLKAITFILWTKLIIISIMIVLASISFILKPESGFLKGVYQGMGLTLSTFTPENFARFLGQLSFHIILLIFTLRSISKKSYKAVCCLLGIQFVIHFKNPIMAIIFIVLLCFVLFGKQTKAYLKSAEEFSNDKNCSSANSIE